MPTPATMVKLMKALGMKAPQDDALEIARINAVKMLGLPENNTPMERARAMGFNDQFYHGSQRIDRVLEKKGLDPKRATSGPNAFGTDNPNIASNYATGKKDTSIPDGMSAADFFTVDPKSLGLRGRSQIPVERAYNYLTPEQRTLINQKAPTVGYADPDQAMGDFVSGTRSITSPDQYRYVLQREEKGNPLSALRNIYLDSGELYGNEEALVNVFKAAGFPHPINQTNAPWYQAQGVIPGVVRMTNPLDTSNTELLKNTVIPALKDAFKSDRTRLKEYGADAWDKNTRYTPKSWVDELESDVNAGKNSFVFTSIPDKVTNALRQLGFDGIKDTGGKSGGMGHTVSIPFEPQQVRSRFAAFDPARVNENNLLASRLLPFALPGLLAIPQDE